MSPKSTWIWVGVAAGLFAVIFVFDRHGRKPLPPPPRILPNFEPANVTSVHVRTAGRAVSEIIAQRTNQTWQLKLSETNFYPADPAAIDRFLTTLEHLSPAGYLSATEMRRRPDADTEYGFASPLASLVIFRGNERLHLLVGSKTAPGDQLYLQVVGTEAAYIVDADLLAAIPSSPGDWRDRSVLNLDGLAFDRLAVTNNTKAFILQRDLADQRWRMIWPFVKGARADNSRIEMCLLKLQNMRVRQFISDDPKPELDRFGLAPPELELVLAAGTNTVAFLQFGKSPTNDPTQVFARRFGQNTIFTVPADLQEPWRAASVNDFRDPRLLTFSEPIESIEMRAKQTFSLQHETNATWRVLPDNFPADNSLVTEFLTNLSGLRIVDFVKEVVNPADLPNYGLATPLCQYVLKSSCPSPPTSDTNKFVVDVSFGVSTNEPGQVFARRADENPVYAISSSDFARLPATSWAFRDRRVWRLSDDDIASVTIHHRGKVRQILHKGTHQWSLGPGSQGILEELPVDATVHGLAQLAAAAWVGRGDEDRARFGFAENGYQIALDLKDGGNAAIEFGGEAPSGCRYAAVPLEGQPWILECPWLLYRDVSLYLSIPP
jgi:uncharacterized protein DUF4340